MDAFSSHRRDIGSECGHARSTIARQYRQETLSGLTADASSLRHPVDPLIAGLKDVRGATTSSNAYPEAHQPSQPLRSDIVQPHDYSPPRLTFRANLTTLTEAERRKVASHRTGKDMYQKMSRKSNMPDWLSTALRERDAEEEEDELGFSSRSPNLHSPTAPYTPPHMDPISPAVVPRNYWQRHETSVHRTQGRSHRDERHSDRRGDRHADRHERKKRRRSEEEHKHERRDRAHKRDGHKHESSSRKRRRHHREHRSRSPEFSRDVGISPEPYRDPGLVPDPLAVGGTPARISARLFPAHNRDATAKIPEWIRSTSAAADWSDKEHALNDFETAEVNRGAQLHYEPLFQPNLHRHPTGPTSAKDQFPNRPVFAPIQPNVVASTPRQVEAPVFIPIVPLNHNQPIRYNPYRTAQISQPPVPTAILQPVPQKPIQMHRFTPAVFTEANNPYNTSAAHYFEETLDSSLPLPQVTDYASPSDMPQTLRSLPPANVRPLDSIPTAVNRDADVSGQSLPPHTQFAHAFKRSQYPSTAFGNSPVRSLPDETSFSTPALTETGDDSEYTDPHEAKTNSNSGQDLIAKPGDSVWNPILANSTATRPDRITLQPSRTYAALHEAYETEAKRDSITVIQAGLQARSRPLQAVTRY